MERYLFVVGLISTLLFVPAAEIHAQENGGAPNQSDMINQRLRSDLEDLREENRQLRRRLERLRQEKDSSSTSAPGTDNELAQENRRLRRMLGKYHEAMQNLIRVVENTDTSLIQDPQPETVTHETGDEAVPGESEKWIRDDQRPYPIRREPLQEEISYTTGPRDTLSKLAHQYYHDAELWIRIYLVNEDRLESPDNLPPGTTLRLPPVDRIRQ